MLGTVAKVHDALLCEHPALHRSRPITWRLIQVRRAGASEFCALAYARSGRLRMPHDTSIVFGVPVPSVDPVFLAVVRFHIVVGIVVVVAGATAMLSYKGRGGRHSTAGTVYYWSLAIIVATATGLSVVRWEEDYHLFLLGTLSLIAATIGRTALRHRWRNWVRLHISGMGVSYMLMLTAFYVDNGKNLPLWRALPQWAFWVLPTVLGLPIVVYAMLRHPRARQ